MKTIVTMTNALGAQTINDRLTLITTNQDGKRIAVEAVILDILYECPNANERQKDDGQEYNGTWFVPYDAL